MDNQTPAKQYPKIFYLRGSARLFLMLQAAVLVFVSVLWLRSLYLSIDTAFSFGRFFIGSALSIFFLLLGLLLIMQAASYRLEVMEDRICGRSLFAAKELFYTEIKSIVLKEHLKTIVFIAADRKKTLLVNNIKGFDDLSAQLLSLPLQKE